MEGKFSCVRIRRFLAFESKDFVCSNQEISCVRIKRFLVFESRDFLCSNQETSCVRIKRFPVFEPRHLVCSNQGMSSFPRRTCAGGRCGTGRGGILVVQTSAEAHLKQNSTHELMVPSVWPCVVRNHAKFAKIIFFDPKISRNLFSVSKNEFSGIIRNAF